MFLSESSFVKVKPSSPFCKVLSKVRLFRSQVFLLTEVHHTNIHVSPVMRLFSSYAQHPGTVL